MAYMRSSDGVRLDAVPIALDPSNPGFDIYVLAGQSNMSGQALGFNAAGPDPVHPRVFCFPQSGSFVGQIVQAADPLGHPDSSRGMGPGLPFARWQTLRTPANRNIMLVPVAWTGSGFNFDINTSPRTWQVGDTTSGIFNLYENAIAQVNAAIAAAAAVGATCAVKGVLWLQGEHDTGTSSATYAAWLDAVIAGLRTRLGVSDLPFVLGQMVPEYIAANPTNLNTTHIDTPRRNTRCAFAYGIAGHDGGTALHYDVVGQRYMGRSMFDAFARAKLNVTGTAPVAPAFINVTQFATSLAIAWDQTNGRVTDFNVEYKRHADSTWTDLSRGTNNLDARATLSSLAAVTSYDIRVRTVNEQGTSAWTTVTSATVAAPPQVTGLAYSNVGVTTATVQWSAAATALSYLIEKSTDGGSTWSTVASGVTALSYNITGLAANTSTKIRVSGVNNAGTGTASAAVTFSTLPSPTTLGVSSVAAARAYSAARKITSNYTGPLIRLRRFSDSQEQDIGFVSGTGELDTAAIATFLAGSVSADVVTLYDQSGNGRHLSQPIIGNRYRFALNGTVKTAGTNSKPTLDGTAGTVAHLFDSNPGLFAAGAGTICAVNLLASPSTQKWLVTETLSSDNFGQYIPMSTDTSSASTLGRSMRNNASASFLSDRGGAATPAAFDGTQHQLTAIDSGVSFSQYVDGTLVGGAATSYSRNSGITLDRFTLGAGIRLSGVVATIGGLLAEVVVWYAALGSTDQTTAQSNQKSYYGTP